MNRKQEATISFFFAIMMLSGIFLISSCGNIKKNYMQNSQALTLDNSAWKYDESNALYYQLGVKYAATPAAPDYETLNVYVPAAYFDAKQNGDGMYTAAVNTTGTVHGYTSATAPVVFPLETPGYAAQQASPDYDSNGVTTFTNEGFVYVFAGMRGRSNGTNSDGSAFAGGAPWGITDLKAAVRYVRFNSDLIPGDKNEVYTGGMSGGGAQSALMGVTGDSELYVPYLESIGAAMKSKKGKFISDAVTGSMDWCPITNLDFADEAYEWNMGQFASTGVRAAGTWSEAMSKDLAAAYPSYFNKLGLVDSEGKLLTLESSADGIYQSGSYYEYLKSVVEKSLEHFISDTSFPYTVTKQAFSAAARFGGGINNLPKLDGNTPAPVLSKDGVFGGQKGTSVGGGAGSSQSDIGVTYKTPESYIASLNKNGVWVNYDKSTGKITIASLKDFVTRLKNATKGIGAFDDTSLSQAENAVFGNSTSDSLHFDVMMAQLLKDNSAAYAQLTGFDSSLADSYAAGVASTDMLGSSSQVRQNMYNPMYYLSSYYDGYGTSTVAKHWRIRTGIEQSDTALCTEVNLALALGNNKNVNDVDFETVWNMQHTMAERTGSSMENFIAWIHACAASDAVVQ
jgi:hypothetical protein